MLMIYTDYASIDNAINSPEQIVVEITRQCQKIDILMNACLCKGETS